MNSDGGSSGEAAGRPQGSFWKSLQGILTGATGVIVAGTALISALNQLGVVGQGSRHSAAGSERRAGASAPLRAVSPNDSRLPNEAVVRRYKVFSPSDGFAMVRQEPSKFSPGLRRLNNGEVVRCQQTTVDSTRGRPWRFCPGQRGYIAASLLIGQ